MEAKLYGEWAYGDDGRPVADVDRILGVRAILDDRKRCERVELLYQWAGDPARPRQLDLQFSEALALLSFLKCMQLDAGIPFPDDPRGPR